MTAKEYFAKRNGGKTPKQMGDDNEFVGAMWCQKLMSDFAIHIADQAVGEERKQWFGKNSWADNILTRINELTQGE